MPSTRALFWSTTRRITLVGSSQSNCDVGDVAGSARIDAQHLLRDRAHRRAMSSPDTRNCTGKPDRRPVLQPRHAAAQRREVVVEELRADACARARAPRCSSRPARTARSSTAAAAGRAAGRSAGCRRRRRRRSSRCPARASRIASIFFASASVAANELPSGSRRSTISSGRDDDGKNCCGTKRNAPSARGEHARASRRSRS